MEEKTKDIIKEIKQSFRLYMNGVTAQSLREKGQEYHVNWGISLQHLQEMAKEYEQNYEVAINLWKDNVRECKILATMLMPVNDCAFDIAMLWIEQTHTQEIAEMATMNLYQHLPFAYDMAFILLASPDTMKQLHGYSILGRLFTKKDLLKEGDINEFTDQVVAALQDNDITVKHAALNAIQRFADVNETYHVIAKSALKTIKMDDWV